MTKFYMKCWYLCNLLIHAYVHYWKLPKYCFDCLFLNAWSSLFLDPDTTGYTDPIPLTLCFIITAWPSLCLDPDPTEYSDPVPLILCFIITAWPSLCLDPDSSEFSDTVFYHYSLVLALFGSRSYSAACWSRSSCFADLRWRTRSAPLRSWSTMITCTSWAGWCWPSPVATTAVWIWCMDQSKATKNPSFWIPLKLTQRAVLLNNVFFCFFLKRLGSLYYEIWTLWTWVFSLVSLLFWRKPIDSYHRKIANNNSCFNFCKRDEYRSAWCISSNSLSVIVWGEF